MMNPRISIIVTLPCGCSLRAEGEASDDMPDLHDWVADVGRLFLGDLLQCIRDDVHGHVKNLQNPLPEVTTIQ